jgi:anti-anti-sigma factor
LPQFESDVRNTVLSGLHVVLDLSRMTYIGADALGSFLHVTSHAGRWKRELWLAGLHPNLDRVIHAAQLRPSFRTASTVAEALRRIEPDFTPVPLLAGNTTFFHIRGKLVPVSTHEMPELYRQVQIVMQRASVDPLPIAGSDEPENGSLTRALLPG